MSPPTLRSHLRYIRDRLFKPLPTPEKWVFIVGCSNSGTSILHDIIAQHPSVGSLPTEGQFLTSQLLTPADVDLGRVWAIEPERFRLTESDGQDIRVDLLKRQWAGHFNDAKRPLLLEKSPPNAIRTRWLQAHFENAHFVGIVRDGYAVAEGIRRRAQRSLEVAATHWAKSNELMVRDFEQLERKMLIRYEELTADPDSIAQDVLGFLGLSLDGLTFSDRSWQIHEKNSEIVNMNPRSWRALSPDDCQIIEAHAHETLERFGYSSPKSP